VIVAVAALVGRIRFDSNPFVSIVAITTGVYALGYAGITTAQSFGGNTRYYLPVMVGTLLLAGAFLPTLFRSTGSGRWVRRTLAVVACVTVVVASFSQNAFAVAAPFSTIRNVPAGAAPFDVTGVTKKPGDALMIERLQKANAIPAGSTLLGSNARTTVDIAFRMDAHAYGFSGQQYNWRDPSLIDLMRTAGIGYFINFTPADDDRADYSEIGSLTASITAISACGSDVKLAAPERCRIDVVKLSER
jgi:hypothetical protein